MKTRLTTNISLAAQVLVEGGLAAFPTETVYGLGANALSDAAVARVFEAKCRPRFDPLIVHIADPGWLPRLVSEVPATARMLIDRFWPGPLTLVLPKTSLVPDLVTAGLPCVAVRMPAHPAALELLRLVDLPIAAPSANPFGRISPTTAQHVMDSLDGRIDLVLDGGPCRIGVESTVVLLTESVSQLLRHGGVPVEDLEQVIGPVSRVPEIHDPMADQAIPAPGMLKQHYAPRTPMRLRSQVTGSDLAGLRLGALSLIDAQRDIPVQAFETLSDCGDLREAAASFFSSLRKLDAAGLDLIVAWPFPEIGLGRALNDRLTRACHS